MPAKKAANELTAIDGVELDLIRDWLDNNRADQMPAELVTYLNHMEVARSQMVRDEDKNFIVKLLMAAPYSLTRYKAMQVFQDTLNFFYIDNQIKAEAWANYYADKKERAANAMRPLIRSAKDHDSYQKAIDEAAKLRLAHRAKEHDLPEGIFKKPVRIYTADVEVLGEGHKKVSREELAQLIEQYDIPETDRKRILAEAGVEKPQINLDDSSDQ